ncbi:hypothetical protein HDV03_003136 [Kappamyces sp. JEL0829]|nr:hypothetical protein HDV03_003136 [Kappamyces sp. JEL0829]
MNSGQPAAQPSTESLLGRERGPLTGPEAIEMPRTAAGLPVKSPRTWPQFLRTLYSFMGPGFLVSVGYLDPGNWATDLAAGSQFGYRLLFVVFLSNLMAMLLQSMYVLCEIAIMATDLAEVIGSAIALNLLFRIPLLWGVLITGLDVMVIVMVGFDAAHMRYFETGIALLVLTTAVCLFLVVGQSGPVVLDVLKGYLPSTEIITAPGSLYVAVGIIGATVMPHNLYLHSSIVKYRSNHDDGTLEEIDQDGESIVSDTQPLRRKLTLPTTLQMSHLDSVFALAFALFVNSAILIIAASNFFVKGETDVAEIADAFRLIGEYLGNGFSTLFAVALLLAGQMSSITGTMAGQIVMEGFLGSSFVMKPWLRRLLTRVLAIGPALVSILVFGESSLQNLLILSQIVLSLQLPFAVWPLIYFTSKREIMTITFRGDVSSLYRAESGIVCAGNLDPSALPMLDPQTRASTDVVDFSNSRLVLCTSVVVATLLTVFNIILLVEVVKGNA